MIEDHKNVGILGGSFDPPHIGHLIAAREAIEYLKLDAVIFVPSARHPHKGENVESFDHRHGMVFMAVDEGGFEVSPIENTLEGPSYTINTLKTLQEKYDFESMTLLIGSDVMQVFHTWYGAKEILDEFKVCTMIREDQKCELDDEWYEFFGDYQYKFLGPVPVPSIAISSSDIRQRLAEGRSIEHMVHRYTIHYIKQHELYGLK